MPNNLDMAVMRKGAVSQARDDIVIDDNLVFGREVRHAYQVSQTKSGNYTMTAADSGYITYIDTDAVVITLPATVVGYTYTFVNAGADGAVGFSISPNASDQIAGVGLTAADNKDIVNTKATARRGDMVRIVADGTAGVGWIIQEMRGTWAREA